MSLPIAVEALDLEDISLVFLDNVGISNRCRRVVTINTSLASILKTFLVLVFFARLTLVGRKLLVLCH